MAASRACCAGGAAGWRLGGARIVVRQRLLARRTLLGRVDRLQGHELSVPRFSAALAWRRPGWRSAPVRALDWIVAGSLFERSLPHAAAD